MAAEETACMLNTRYDITVYYDGLAAGAVDKPTIANVLVCVVVPANVYTTNIRESETFLHFLFRGRV